MTEDRPTDMIPVLAISPQPNGRDRVYVGLASAEACKRLSRQQKPEALAIYESRTVIWYTRTAGSLDGLGETGPTDDCRLGTTRSGARLVWGITDLGAMTPAAWAACRAQPVVS